MTRAVRQATTDDAWTVHETARASWHAAYDDVLGSERVDEIVDEWYALGDLESSIEDADDRSDAQFLVAVPSDERREPANDGGIGGEDCLGFAHVVPWPEDEAVGYLARIYVAPDHWGEGIGTALLERLESEVREEFDRLRLAVLADNEVGVSFYESTGFRRVETRETDLADGLEEHVYEKRL